MISEVSVWIVSDRAAMHIYGKVYQQQCVSYCSVDITKCSNLPSVLLSHTVTSECTALFTPDKRDVSVCLLKSICVYISHSLFHDHAESMASANCNPHFNYTLDWLVFVTYSEEWTQAFCQGNNILCVTYGCKNPLIC